MKTWTLYWAPTGACIAAGIQAQTARAAIRKGTPQPYRRYLGEVWAEEASETA